MENSHPGCSNLIQDDDPVVKEIPIYHSTRLQKRLYALQYNFLPKHLPTSNMPIKKGYFKPNNEEMKLEIGIDVESPNFDSDLAEITAQEIDGGGGTSMAAIVNDKNDKKNNKQSILFENQIVDKVFLKSTKPVKTPNKYAALVYNGKEIHLTTLKNLFQFRPNFNYLDRPKKRKNDRYLKAESDDSSDNDNDTTNDHNNVEQITVKFKQSDGNWKKPKHAQHNYKAMQAKSAEESWHECNISTEQSSLSKVEKLKLLSENTEATGQAANLTNTEYLRVLIPEDQEQKYVEPTLPSHIMSLHALRAKPLLEQLRCLLKVANIIQFNQLLMTLAGGDGLTNENLLKTLPKVAVLVRGNWIVKSDVLYPNNTFSSTSGVPAELMCRARDYVLYLFTKNQYVERKKVSSVMKIPSEEVSEIFTGFSKLSHNKGWELLLQTDHEFIIKHNDIVQKQNELWEQRFKQLIEFVKDNKRQRRKSKSIGDDISINSKIINKNTTTTTTTHNNSSDNESGNEKKSPVASRKNKVMKFKETDDS